MSALALTVPEGCRERAREARAPTGGRVKRAATDAVRGALWHGLLLAVSGCVTLSKTLDLSEHVFLMTRWGQCNSA